MIVCLLTAAPGAAVKQAKGEVFRRLPPLGAAADTAPAAYKVLPPTTTQASPPTTGGYFLTGADSTAEQGAMFVVGEEQSDDVGFGDIAESLGATLDTFGEEEVTGVGFHKSCPCGSCGECCDGCCGDCCGDVCCCPPPCCKPCFWVGGVEATFLAADTTGNRVGYLLDDNIAAPPVLFGFNSDGSSDLDDLYVAPRLWLGFQRCNWGVQMRYWHMRPHNDGYDPFIIGPGGFDNISDIGSFVFNQFDLYTIDVEGTYSFCCCCDVKNTISFGTRYAYADHTLGLSGLADVDSGGGAGTGFVQNTAYARSKMDGAGLTGSWFARKPLFCNSCIHLIGGLRGSVVWGESLVVAETSASAIGPGAGAASTNIGVVVEDEAMFIGEAQFGLQWDYRVQCFPADAFFRIVAEYQYWGTGDSLATATSFSGFGAGPTSSGTSTAVASAIDVDLYGISIGTGFTW